MCREVFNSVISCPFNAVTLRKICDITAACVTEILGSCSVFVNRIVTSGLRSIIQWKSGLSKNRVNQEVTGSASDYFSSCNDSGQVVHSSVPRHQFDIGQRMMMLCR